MDASLNSPRFDCLLDSIRQRMVNVNSIALHATYERNVLLADSLCFVLKSNNTTSTALILWLCNHSQRDMICLDCGGFYVTMFY